MNIRKFVPLSWNIATNLTRTIAKSRTIPVAFTRRFTDGGIGSFGDANPNHKAAGGLLLALTYGIFSFFSKKDDEKESPEQTLIDTIKRSVLCIQKEEYDKAEQMLHLALRIAQDLQSKDGITYIYDLMANVALEQEQYAKSEKLFADVMKRMFSDGYKDDDVQMLHISSKIAHIAQLQGQFEKAVKGFIWTLEKLEEKLKAMPDDEELRELWGLTKNWYGQTLMENENYKEARQCLMDAYKTYTSIHGKMSAEALTMLNNLSVASTYLEDFNSARKFLDEALDIAKDLPDAVETGMLKANLGLLYLKQGLLQQAKEACTFAWRFGKRMGHKDIVEQADRCLKLVNEVNK